MKNLKPIIFTAIALGAFAFPTGCVQKKAPPPKKDTYVILPKKDPQKELDLKLLRAAHDKDLATVKDCVKKGGNVNVKDPSGWSAAMWSVWHWFDDKPLCAYIMHSGGEFAQHQKDNLLERAARTGDYARAEFFLNLGANPNYVNAFGENCATLALRYFRGQYGIAETDEAKARYAKLDDINAALKLNAEVAATAEKRMENARKLADDYKARAEAFAKSPQGSASALAEFEKQEFEIAKAFLKSEKNSKEGVPATLTSAAEVYAKLLTEAKAELSGAEKNLQYVKFIALLKNTGANLRKLLAGKQDNSGKQDDWKGQEDKWTADPVARLSVRETFPYVVDGLWDGELALIQLIGRGEDIFLGQMRSTTLPVPKAYFFELCLNNKEFTESQKQGDKAVSDLVRNQMKQARTTHWKSLSMRGGMNFGGVGGNVRVGDGVGTGYDADFVGFGLGFSLGGGSVTTYTEATAAEKESAFARGAEKGAERGRYLGAMEIVMNGDSTLKAINEVVETSNKMAREHNAKLFEMYEEFPLEGELAEKWAALWERRMTRQSEWQKNVTASVRGHLEAEAARLEKSLKRAGYAPASGNAGNAVQSYNAADEAAEKRFEEETEMLEKIKKFLASDFFKEVPLEELLKNPPHPRDADPMWYAKNCLGKFKTPEVFTDAAKAFLDFGADVNARANVTDHPALVCALLWEKPEFEELLLNYGADKKLALFHICERNDFDLLKKLLPRIDSLAEVPADDAGNTILHRAVLAGRADMIPEIVKRGVSVDARNKHADTPLHLAAEAEDEACVIALLDLKANVNATDKDGRKPFQRFWNVPNPDLARRLNDARK